MSRTAEHPVVRALCAIVEDRCTVALHREQPWASITFAGARHTVELQFVGDEPVAMGETLIEVLPEHEFALAGKIVADASIRWVERRMLPETVLTVKIELLVLDDA